MCNILVVDDEIEIVNLIEFYLKNEGYNVIKCLNGEEVLQRTEKEEFDLIILDVMLSGIDGFDVCRKIRERYFYPIIMLTAKNEGIDKIMGLTLGADDYITKPFNPLELVARVKTQLRRYRHYNTAGKVKMKSMEEIDIRGLVINKNSRKCCLFGREVDLTPLEFRLVWYLCINRGRVISSEELYKKVWRENYLDNNNTVMAHIARIRDKMKEPSRKPKFIKTVWGVGYTIE